MPNKGRNLLLSGLVALSAMFGYAIAAGLVQVGSGHSMAGLVSQVVLSQFFVMVYLSLTVVRIRLG